MNRKPDRPPSVGYSAGDRLADPPSGVGRELEALPPVKLLHGVHQAEVALLDEVQKGEPGRLVLLGYGHDQSQVGLDEGLLSLLAPHASPTQLSSLGGDQPLGSLVQLLLCLPPGLDSLR